MYKKILIRKDFDFLKRLNMFKMKWILETLLEMFTVFSKQEEPRGSMSCPTFSNVPREMKWQTSVICCCAYCGFAVSSPERLIWCRTITRNPAVLNPVIAVETLLHFFDQPIYSFCWMMLIKPLSGLQIVMGKSSIQLKVKKHISNNFLLQNTYSVWSSRTICAF